MKTKVRRDSDGKYKYIDTSKCLWGLTPTSSACGLAKCAKQCLVVLSPEEYAKE